MTKISILYLNKPGARFDFPYYTGTHMPLSIKLLSAHPGFRSVSVERGLGGPLPGSAAAYLAMCHFEFDSAESFMAAFLPHMQVLQSDMPNYTDIEPVIQVNEVLIAKQIDQLKHARAFAIAAHGEQKYGTHPYAYHLDAVVGLLPPFGITAQIIGYLHDVAEDTAVPLEIIRQQFGDLVADCVKLVTDAPGANRAERKAITNAKLSAVTGELELALIVKAADRLANLRMCAQSDAGGKLQMYRLEHPAFRQAAYRAGLCEQLWSEMDRILSTVS